jgi:PhnB protein
MSDQKIPSLIPVLTVDEIESAVAFYKKLGFSEVFSFPDETGKLVHAHISKGDSALFLGRTGISHYPSHERAIVIERSRKQDRGIGITLMLQVDNLEAIYEVARRERLQILAEPVDEYYGDRVFFFIDPFGYEWKISQPIAMA